MSDETHPYRPMTMRDGSFACSFCHGTPSDPIHATFGRAIRQLRRADLRGLSLVETAESIGVPISVMSDIERDECQLSLSATSKLLKFLNSEDQLERVWKLQKSTS